MMRKKNRVVASIVCLSILVLTVLLTGCVETRGWNFDDKSNSPPGTETVVLKGIATTKHNNWPLLSVSFLFDDEPHSETDLDYDEELEPSLERKIGQITYFEAKKTLPSDGEYRFKPYYFRAKAVYRVQDGTQPSAYYGEEISFSLTD